MYLEVKLNDLEVVSIVKLASISATAGAAFPTKVLVRPVYAVALVMVF